MKALRLHIRMPTAHWRVGFTQYHLHRTYPLPPPSTVLGMIHNVMGCKTGETIKNIDIAIAGTYESIMYQYQIFRNINNPSNAAYKEAHPGQSYPNQVQLLHNVELWIYIKQLSEGECTCQKCKDNKNILESIKEAFINPSVPFFLGRREDLCIIEEGDIEIIELREEEFPYYFKIPMWIPDENNYGLKGVSYLLPTYYELKDNNRIRDFERKWLFYAEKQYISLIDGDDVPKGYVDEIEYINENEENEEEKRKSDNSSNTNDEKEKKLKIPVIFLNINNKGGKENECKE